jgi:hypothetical protein
VKEPITLCPYCAGVVAEFAKKNPHANIPALRRARWHGCCRYWLKRGIPTGWWT